MRQINWLALIPQLILMLGLMFLLEYGLQWQGGAILGAMIYLGLITLLQAMIPHFHRRGLALIRKEDFAEAKKMFEESYAQFSAKKWLDDFRAVLIFNVSKMSYREMALLNVAYCMLRLGDEEGAKKQYESTLQEFPKCQMAADALAYLNGDKEL